jgi:prepilin-type N-terminal cleavage/methylation domain-containing protein
MSRRAFTLIELLVVVAILAILTAIAVVNLRDAMRRALSAQCKSHLRTIVTGLQMYRIDWNRLPFSDGSTGPLVEGQSFRPTVFGDGPAAGGSWNAVPQILVTGPVQYFSGLETLGCPALRREHRDEPGRWRYAYNVGGFDSNGFVGGADPAKPIDGPGTSGEHVWLARCLFINSFSFAPDRFSGFPHGPDMLPEENEWGEENVLYNSGEVVQEPGLPPL